MYTYFYYHATHLAGGIPANCFNVYYQTASPLLLADAHSHLPPTLCIRVLATVSLQEILASQPAHCILVPAGVLLPSLSHGMAAVTTALQLPHDSHQHSALLCTLSSSLLGLWSHLAQLPAQ